MKSYSVLRKVEKILEREGIGLLTVNEKTCKVCKIIDAGISNKKLGTVTLKEISGGWRNRYVKKYP